MVFIMPGMENLAPERTLTRSGSDGTPSFLPISFSSLATASMNLIIDFLRHFVAVFKEEVTDLGRNGEPGGTGTPALLISARPAPLPPSTSFMVPSPSAVPPPNE